MLKVNFVAEGGLIFGLTACAPTLIGKPDVEQFKMINHFVLPYGFS